MLKLLIFTCFFVYSHENLCIQDKYIIPLFSTKIIRLNINQIRLKQFNFERLSIRAKIADKTIAKFHNDRSMINKRFYLNTSNLTNDFQLNYKIYGSHMNITSMDYSIRMFTRTNYAHEINCSIVIFVSQPQRIIDKIFKIAIPYIIMFISIQMGMLLDIEILKELIRRPIQVAIGFIAQYIFMPLIAFAITKLFAYPAVYGLGLFVVGCCPGGSQSNQWTVVFDGDLNLSAFMSFASTIASFIMMPFWLYTFGQVAYLRHLKIFIPFLNLMLSLLTIIVPLGIGMLIVYFVPKSRQWVEKIFKTMLIILIAYFFIFGAIVNFYLRNYVSLRIALTAPLLPWLGFILGGCFAWICRQDWKRTLTIAIETGIQNIGIAVMVLFYSLPSPENSQTTVIPIIVAFLSPLPFYLILFYQLLQGKLCRVKKKLPPRISIDTLSKTTRQLSEFESEVAHDVPLNSAQ